MLFHLLADLVLLVHFSFVAFVVLGGLLVLRWPKLGWAHFPAATWGIFIEYAQILCPLTTLEVALRQRAGQAGYSGGFIAHYITPVLYPAGLTRAMQFGLGTFALLLNVTIYAWIFTRHRRAAALRATASGSDVV